jgi:metallo-beta-lactamase family protein
MNLSFHGADRDVTDSCHLVEAKGKRILVDCGMYQGGRELNEENTEDFGFDPTSIDLLLLTHAHLDHCERIPLLVRRGFQGEIVTTSATRELARVVMLDAAHLQEEEAERHARHASRRDQHAPEPLYGMLDALSAMERFGRTAAYGRSVELAPKRMVLGIGGWRLLHMGAVLVRESTSGWRRGGGHRRAGRRQPVAGPSTGGAVIATGTLAGSSQSNSGRL